MDETTRWVLAGALGAVLALIGILYNTVVGRADKTERHLEKQEEDRTKLRERLTAVEAEVEQIKLEVRTLRDRWHDLVEHVTKSLADWYNRIMDEIRKR